MYEDCDGKNHETFPHIPDEPSKQAHLEWMLMDGDDFVLHFNKLLMVCVTHWRWSHSVCVLPVCTQMALMH